jgi:hypothetical protein
MMHRLYQIALAACQLGIVICFPVFTGELDPGGVLAGIILAAIFTSSVIILLNLPRGIIRWSVAVLYAAAFAAMFCLARIGEPVSPQTVAGGILFGFYGCVLVAIGVIIVRWFARLLSKIPSNKLWKDSGDGNLRDVKRSERVTKLRLNEVMPEGDRRRKPIFGPGAPRAFCYVVAQVAVVLLSAWLYSSH